MKTYSILLGAILMAAIAPAFAQSTPASQGTDMPANCMQMGEGMQSSSMQGMQMGKGEPCAKQTARATGVIEAIDVAKGTVTIKHQAVASIHWPAMTMAFRADPPALLQGIKVGERVNFTLYPAGMNSTVTAIAPVK